MSTFYKYFRHIKLCLLAGILMCISYSSYACKAKILAINLGPGQFQYIDSSTSANPIKSWHWNLGDGNISTNQNPPPHTYTNFGSFLIILTISDSLGCVDTDYVNVLHYPCNASFDDSLIFGRNYKFSNHKFTPPSTTWTWFFGDSTTSNTPEVVTHEYAQGGPYFVRLMLTDSARGCYDTVGKYINVAHTCAAGFIDSVQNDSTYKFSNQSSGISNNTNWSWDFGDGTTDTARSPLHVFKQAGKYNVCLTLNDITAACTSSFCSNISSGFFYELSGSISAGGGPFNQGAVALARLDEIKEQWVMTDTAIVSGGSFVMGTQPEGWYTMRAYGSPLDSLSKKYFPTYTGSKIYWFDAYFFELNKQTQSNITMVSTKEVAKGPGQISGVIWKGSSDSGFPGGIGDPIEGVVVILRDASNNPLTFDFTDTSGVFKFEVPFGNYSLYTEIPGKTTDVVNVSVQSGNPVSDNNYLNVYKYFISRTTSSGPNISANLPLKLFPNPATDRLGISSGFDRPLTAGISVLDISGKEIMRFTEQIAEGEQLTSLDISGIAQGVYLLRVIIEGEAPLHIRFIRQ